MKIRPVGADGRTDRQTVVPCGRADGERYMTKPRVAFRNAPKKRRRMSYLEQHSCGNLTSRHSQSCIKRKFCGSNNLL